MTFLSLGYALLFYAATAILGAGLAFKIRQYGKTPAPLKIPTTPAPVTRTGVVLRLIGEVTLFQSLFKSNRWIWLFAVAFHGGLLLVLLRHLRYFTEPVWFWVDLVQPFGVYGGMAMVVGLLGLWLRRIVVDRVRYISAPSDHLMLALLTAIGLSGLGMTYIAHTDIIQAKAFALGLLYFDWQPLPGDPALLVHLLLVALLMIVLPFSKLLHIPGVFFSPGRNQIDNPREKRHLADWAKPMDAERQP